MKIRLIIPALVFVMLIMMCNAVFAYSDVDNHWAEKEINNMALNGIVSGYTDGTFRPNQNMTRAELITVINRILGNSKQNTRFVPDINVKDWYYAEIRKAIESGFVEGNSKGYVRPTSLITREEAIVMLQRALVPVGTDVVVSEVKDADEISSWASKSISSFINKGYIKGYTDGTIKPRKNISRAEVVKIISNIIGKYVSFGEYTGESNGTIVVNGPNVKFKDLTINGSLIVAEGAENLSLENVYIKNNLIIRRDYVFSDNDYKLDGKKTYINYHEQDKDARRYINSDYGISFAIPNDAIVEDISNTGKKSNNKSQNYMTIKVYQSDGLYFLSYEDGLKSKQSALNSNYELLEKGYVDYYRYTAYENKKSNSYYIYIKRDNIEYEINLYNINNINVVDSLLNSITFSDGKLITNHRIKNYDNKDLNLKFRYPDYVAVDDSYNTNVVNEDQDAYFKLFLQVNNIIDMSSYTVEQLKSILVSLEDSDGEIIESQIKKVYIYDAIEYTVKNDGKLFKSLYIIISNKLYHFVFLSSEDKMSSAGLEIYGDIVNSIEF